MILPLGYKIKLLPSGELLLGVLAKHPILSLEPAKASSVVPVFVLDKE
jgi:hypothetical protein